MLIRQVEKYFHNIIPEKLSKLRPNSDFFFFEWKNQSQNLFFVQRNISKFFLNQVIFCRKSSKERKTKIYRYLKIYYKIRTLKLIYFLTCKNISLFFNFDCIISKYLNHK